MESGHCVESTSGGAAAHGGLKITGRIGGIDRAHEQALIFRIDDLRPRLVRQGVRPCGEVQAPAEELVEVRRQLRQDRVGKGEA